MNLAPIIHSAVMGGSREVQEQGERTLVALRQGNPALFLLECSQLTMDERLDELIRQSAATVLGRSFMLTDSNSNRYLWDLVPADTKQEIRNNLVNTLVSPSEIAKRGASNAISYIAAIEVPRGQWQELIRNLLTNVSNANEEFQRTSIMAIGFICEQFKQCSVHISSALEDAILATLIKAMEDSKMPIRTAALKAIRDSIGFMNNVLRQKAVRDHLMTLLMGALNARETQEIALQGISEFVKFNFEYLEPYITALFEVTFPIMSTVNNSTISALDLWDSIGAQYVDRLTNVSKRMQNKDPGNNLLMAVQERLVPTVLGCLIIIDGQDNVIRDAALKAMTTLADVCGKAVFPVVTTFVGNAIQNSEPNIRQASSLAFTSLCECRGLDDKKAVEGLLSMAIDAFVGLLNDQSRLVVQAAAQSFVKFNEFYPGVLLRSTKYESYIATILNAMGRSEKTTQQLVASICNLTEGLSQPENSSCSLARDPFPLLNKITHFGFTSRATDIVYGCFMAATGILQACTDTFLATNYIQFLINKYQEFQNNDETSRAMRGGLLTAMHSAVLIMRDNRKPDNDAIMDKVFQFVAYHFERFREVDNDGLYIISGLATSFQSRFYKHLDRAWNFILHALSKENDSTLIKGALICISDMARMMDGRFTSRFDSALETCFTLMQKNIDRTLKCQIFLTLADCMIADKEKASRRKREIINMIDLGFQGVINLQNSSDDFQYAEQLKESVIDFYECVSASIIDVKQGCSLFREHFKKLIMFVILTTKRELNPTVDYLKSCMFLVLDTANCYLNERVNNNRQEIDAELHRNELREVIHILSRYSSTHPDIKELMTYAQRVNLN